MMYGLAITEATYIVGDIKQKRQMVIIFILAFGNLADTICPQ
jgi:hypothetical protein